LDQLDLKKKRLLNLYVDGELERNSYRAKMAELNKNEAFLSSRLNAFRFDSDALTKKVQDIVQDFLEIYENYEKSRVTKKVRILQAMCEEAVIGPEGKV